MTSTVPPMPPVRGRGFLSWHGEKKRWKAEYRAAQKMMEAVRSDSEAKRETTGTKGVARLPVGIVKNPTAVATPYTLMTEVMKIRTLTPAPKSKILRRERDQDREA